MTTATMTTMRSGAMALLAALLLSCGGIEKPSDSDGGAAPAPTLLALSSAGSATSGAGPVALTATHTGSGTVTWQLGSGSPGSLSAASGNSVNYLPPPAGAVGAPVTVTVTASVDGVSRSTTITLNPAPSGVYLAAGTVNGFGNLNGTGSAARFSLSLSFGFASMAFDSHGNAFTSNSYDRSVRRITPQGDVTTYAGRFGTAASTDGPLASATFAYPSAIAVDRGDNLYVGDNNLVRKITPAGVVSTLAALESAGTIQGLAVDANGTVYAATRTAIHVVGATGAVTTLAGGGVGSFVDSPNGFGWLGGIALDAAGNLIAADFTRRVVWQVAPGGVVTTLAGSEGNDGDADGSGTSARFRAPAGVAIDAAGRIFVTDAQSMVVRLITRSGSGVTVATFAGHNTGRNTATRFLPDSAVDGSATAAQFTAPSGVAVNAAGELLVADGSAIRKVGTNGTVTTLAGVLLNFRAADGSGSNAAFDYAYYGGALWADAGGTLFLAEAQSNAVRRITAGGVVTTIAGALYAAGSADGAAASARFSGPRGITGDANGNLYVADSNNRTIRKIASDGTVSTLAGSVGLRGTEDGNGSAARFMSPDGMVLDRAGNLFVIDNRTTSLAIRRITPAGVVTTIAQIEGDYAEGLAIDAADNLYLGGFNLAVVYKITPGGTVSILAGTAGEYGTTDGTGPDARFNGVGGVTTDPAGNVYAMDTGSATIRRISPAGVVTTVAGTPGQFGNNTAATALPGTLPAAWAIRYAGPNTLALHGDNGILKVILP